MDHDHSGHETPPSFWRSRYAIGLVVIGAIAGYFLLTEHLAHVVGALPYLFLLAWTTLKILVATFGELVKGERKGRTLRQYWQKRADTWKIIYEGVVG